MNKELEILEGQLRECYGRVVYSHKTHEKCADILLKKLNCIKFFQIVLSAIITGGLVTSLFDIQFLVQYQKMGLFVGTILSTTLLILNSYIKDDNMAEIAQKHRQAGADLWIIREKYLSLITDLVSKDAVEFDEVRQRRDSLAEELYSVYKGAPSTNFKAYLKAQNALKEYEDMTFSDREIDAFLPKELKRDNRK